MSDLDQYEAALTARDGLISKIAQTSARAAHDTGIEFDVDDPRVARWLLLTTFEGIFTPFAKRPARELLAVAEKVSDGESRAVYCKRRKGEPKQPIVTWDHLVAWANTDADDPLSSRPSKP